MNSGALPLHPQCMQPTQMLKDACRGLRDVNSRPGDMLLESIESQVLVATNNTLSPKTPASQTWSPPSAVQQLEKKAGANPPAILCKLYPTAEHCLQCHMELFWAMHPGTPRMQGLFSSPAPHSRSRKHAQSLEELLAPCDFM